MQFNSPTKLEAAVLQRLHELHRQIGMPSPDQVRVLHRQNTGNGRYVDIDCDVQVQMADGYIDLEGAYIEMKGLPNGMMAVAHVKGQKLKQLEFAVYGGDYWDGEEQTWQIS